MSAFDNRIRQRVQAITGKTGTANIILRRVTSTGGPAPALNPPNHDAGTVDSAALLGDSTLDIAGGFRGRIVPGDKFSLGGTLYTVTNEVVANSHGKFVGVTFSPALAANADPGDAVTFAFAADTPILGRIVDIPLAMVDGTQIRESDISIIVPGASLPFEPTTSDILLFRGHRYTIVRAAPSYVKDEVGLWRIHARG